MRAATRGILDVRSRAGETAWRKERLQRTLDVVFPFFFPTLWTLEISYGTTERNGLRRGRITFCRRKCLRQLLETASNVRCLGVSMRVSCLAVIVLIRAGCWTFVRSRGLSSLDCACICTVACKDVSRKIDEIRGESENNKARLTNLVLEICCKLLDALESLTKSKSVVASRETQSRVELRACSRRACGERRVRSM